MLVVVAAVDALGKLHHKETMAKLQQFVAQNKSVDTASLVISHTTDFLRSNDPSSGFLASFDSFLVVIAHKSV